MAEENNQETEKKSPLKLILMIVGGIVLLGTGIGVGIFMGGGGDTDPSAEISQIIEKKEKSTIDKIFREKGENYFRQIENKISIEHLKKEKSVISLGGGAFLNNSIRRVVKNSSISFWLDVNLELLVKRLKKGIQL